MITRLKHVAPVQLGIVLGLLYAVIGLLIGVILAVASAGGSTVAGMRMLSLGWLSIIVAPIAYGIIGFVAGLIYAWLYNLVAGLTGGVERTLETHQTA